MSATASASVRVQCSVMGLGPLFKLKLAVQNTGGNALTKVPIVTTGDNRLYDIAPALMVVPVLVPLQSYTFEVVVKVTDVAMPPSSVTVYVMGNDTIVPLLCVQVQMPASDLGDFNI